MKCTNEISLEYLQAALLHHLQWVYADINVLDFYFGIVIYTAISLQKLTVLCNVNTHTQTLDSDAFTGTNRVIVTRR